MTSQEAKAALQDRVPIVQAQTAIRQCRAKLEVYRIEPDPRLLDEAIERCGVAVERLEEMKGE